MPITDKTRKMLWGRPGNRCAICKNELVVDASPNDVDSVVGEECHIISSRPSGPRHDPSFPADQLDSYENLILLCRTHHKMVDDQTATFTADILRQMKSNHTIWVTEKLNQEPVQQPVRLRRVKQNVPTPLSRLTTGKQVLDLVTNAMGYAFDHDELKSQEEVDLIGSFLQVAQDWGELSSELESDRRVQISYDLTNSLREIEDAGFFVFGGREVQVLEGGAKSIASDWPIAILRVVRNDSKEIQRPKIDRINKENAQSTI